MLPSPAVRQSGADMARLDHTPRIHRRLGDPLAWSTAGKCLFVALTFLTFSLWYCVSWFYLLQNPAAAPWVAHDFLPVALGLQHDLFEGARAFVVPNPSGRNANYSYDEMLAAFSGLSDALGKRH